MTAIEILREDHQEVLRIIDELEMLEDDSDEIAQAEPDSFNQLHYALNLHTQLEEEVFYPALENFDETRALIRVSYREHEEIDHFLARLSLLTPSDERFQELLSELRSSLEHHIEEEEGELFPKAEELCGSQRLKEMGKQMEDLKHKAQATAVTMK
jgi:iron-sulfur cluster repair protein YtfE (RIC family)